MKYGLSHYRGKELERADLEKMSAKIRKDLGHLVGKVEFHPLDNGIRFSPSCETYKKDINLILKTKVVPKYHFIFKLYSD